MLLLKSKLILNFNDMKNNYSMTLTACSVGYVVQAVINNFLPLLFVYFVSIYEIPLSLITVLVSYNFILQIAIDYFSSAFILKIGYRKTAIISACFAILAFIVLAVLPNVLKGYMLKYISIMLAVTLMAIGSGVSEVILSPIIEALPFENKEAKMSFLHSFYALGHLFIILSATAFFVIFGIEKWYIFSILLIIIPLFEILLFLKCPIIKPSGDEVRVKKSKLFKDKTFILLFLLMIMAGASEQAIAQWASFFAEKGLNVSKTTGDLIGASTFALFMFISRMFYGLSKDKLNLKTTITVCALLLTACYVLTVIQPSAVLSLVFVALCGLFVGIMWPGVYALGGKIFSQGGTVMFSMLALGGDIGCSIGPMLVGAVASKFDINLGILIATIFPFLLFIGMIILKRNKKTSR